MLDNSVIVPPHVPPELVYDFDLYNLESCCEDIQLAWVRLRDRSPALIWTPRNGGHWVSLASDDIKTIQSDFERFSNSGMVIPPDTGRPLMMPLEIDPPEHRPYRKVIMEAFLPAVTSRLETLAREISQDIIRRLGPRGSCEFVSEYANILPVAVFLDLMGLPQDDRDTLAPWGDAISRGTPAERASAFESFGRYLGAKLAERAAHPREDMLTTLVQSHIGDRRATADEALTMAIVLLLGGLDTVTAMLGFFALFLARNPEHRRQLAADPSLIPNAVEELLRRHGLISNGRLVRSDTMMSGVLLKKGDIVQAPSALYGLDEKVALNALTVDFNRVRPKHLTFGGGPHMCPGQQLARRELKVFLEEWMACIPEFDVDPARPVEIQSGLASTVLSLHLRWNPVGTIQ